MSKAMRVHIELSRVQTWLFAVPRLRAMVGANASVPARSWRRSEVGEMWRELEATP